MVRQRMKLLFCLIRFVGAGLSGLLRGEAGKRPRLTILGGDGICNILGDRAGEEEQEMDNPCLHCRRRQETCVYSVSMLHSIHACLRVASVHVGTRSRTAFKGSKASPGRDATLNLN